MSMRLPKRDDLSQTQSILMSDVLQDFSTSGKYVMGFISHGVLLWMIEMAQCPTITLRIWVKLLDPNGKDYPIP